jgi:P-type Cu+ transporter
VVQTTTLSIGGMGCAACIRHVSRALDAMTGVVDVTVDLQRHQAVVEHLPDWVGEAGLMAAIKDAGYPSRVIARDV